MRKISIIKIAHHDNYYDADFDYCVGPICEFIEVSEEEFQLLVDNLHRLNDKIFKYRLITEIPTREYKSILDAIKDLEEKEKIKLKKAQEKKAKKLAEESKTKLQKKKEQLAKLQNELKQLESECQSK